MLMAGFLMHPNLLGFELATTAEQLATKFHHNPLFHIGHVIVTFILAVDKGSLCLVLSAFDALPEAQFATLVPSLQVIVDMEGLLWINRLLVLLSVGGIIQSIGLIKEKHLATWQGAAIALGLLLQINPGYDLINAIGVGMMMLGFFPLGYRTLKSALTHDRPGLSTGRTESRTCASCP